MIPVADGCWLAIGDVTGHGLHAGLIDADDPRAWLGMLVRAQPDAAPADLLRALNEQLYDNIRQRLQHDEHVTFTLLRYTVDGLVAGSSALTRSWCCGARRPASASG